MYTPILIVTDTAYIILGYCVCEGGGGRGDGLGLVVDGVGTTVTVEI